MMVTSRIQKLDNIVSHRPTFKHLSFKVVNSLLPPLRLFTLYVVFIISFIQHHFRVLLSRYFFLIFLFIIFISHG